MPGARTIHRRLGGSAQDDSRGIYAILQTFCKSTLYRIAQKFENYVLHNPGIR